MSSYDVKPKIKNAKSLSTSVESGKYGSTVSVNTHSSVRSHKEYIESLVPPTQEEVQRISSVQEAREEEILKKRISMENPELTEDERAKAATLIQRNYRGYRERRQIQGLGLDPSTRWIEAVREARYRNLTTPRARTSHDEARIGTGNDGTQEQSDGNEVKRLAKENWKKIGYIARRAAEDDDSDSESDEDDGLTGEQQEEKRRKRRVETEQRQRDAKVMDLQYFLEMVDLKHRYGANLRMYHQEWQKSTTQENFFYWLDEGEGRYVDIAACPREQLERERVRYLSREERLDYLVKIDKQGRLVWAKNGVRIDTTEKYKDSIHGIVPSDDPTPAYKEPDAEVTDSFQDDEAAADETSDSSDEEHHHANSGSTAAEKYATPGFDSANGMKKVKHVSASTIFTKLLRSSIKKNTWIFVADTNFRLYVGIKQSGVFQHSSFLHGSRISAAGLIKIKDGLLDKLSPLSGHYRPNTSQFRAFIHSLKEAGADMSHVSISKSYAFLVGLEAYVKTRRRGKKIVRAIVHGRDVLLTHDELKKKEESELEKRETAETEKRLEEIQEDEDARESNIADIKLLDKLHIRPTIPKHAFKGTVEDTQNKKPEEAKAIPSGNTADTGTGNESLTGGIGKT